jgi:hypothetical protein
VANSSHTNAGKVPLIAARLSKLWAHFGRTFGYRGRSSRRLPGLSIPAATTADSWAPRLSSTTTCLGPEARGQFAGEREEQLAVGRVGEARGRDHAVDRHHRDRADHLTVALRDARHDSLAGRRPAVRPMHLRGRANSSMNTTSATFTPARSGWRNHPARAAATSDVGRCCSAACADFVSRQAEPGERTARGRPVRRLGQGRDDLGERRVGPALDQGPDPASSASPYRRWSSGRAVGSGPSVPRSRRCWINWRTPRRAAPKLLGHLGWRPALAVRDRDGLAVIHRVRHTRTREIALGAGAKRSKPDVAEPAIRVPENRLSPAAGTLDVLLEHEAGKQLGQVKSWRPHLRVLRKALTRSKGGRSASPSDATCGST